MDDITRRYYDDLLQTLASLYPGEPVTPDQVEELATAEWGTTVRELEIKREGALEAVNAIALDATTRAEVIEEIRGYFDHQRERFDERFAEAVAEVHQAYGLPTPSQSSPERQDQSQTHAVPMLEHAWEQRIPHLGRHIEHVQGDRIDDLRRLSQRQHGESLPRPVFHNGRELPSWAQPPTVDDRVNSSTRRALTPKHQLIPPLDFTRRHRAEGPSQHVLAQEETWEQLCARMRQSQPSQVPNREMDREHEIEREWERSFER